MLDVLSRPWPWYIAGPLIGLIVPALLVLDNKQFGVSSNLRHLCAAMVPSHVEFFQYDWKKNGTWNLVFFFGILIGGFTATHLLGAGVVAISPETKTALTQLGVSDFTHFAPADIFSWQNLLTLRGLVSIVGGGFLVGFGTAYAGGCTSGHAVSGLAALEPASLVAVVAFFVGGMLCTYFILPLLF